MAVGAAVLVLFWLLAPMLMPFVVAAVLAYVCDPLVRRLQAHRVPRALAALLVVLGLGAVLLLAVAVLVPMFYREALALVGRLPDWLERINTRLIPWLAGWLGTPADFQLDLDFLRGALLRYRESLAGVAGVLWAGAQQGGTAIAGFLAALVLIPVVMFYVLLQWPHLLAGVQELVPRPALARTRKLAREIDAVLSEFLRGQLSVMGLLALWYSLGLWLAGVQFALPVGLLTGLLSFIPFVGFGGGLLLALMAALMQGAGWSPLIGVGVVYGVGQVLESYVLTPWLVGERVGLHPLAVIFALMAFGELFGFVGMLVALPVSAALLVGLRELRAEWLTSAVYCGDAPQEQTPPCAN
ncbi:MAG: AI-2E family transporter [Rhodocyclaceae bacterium]|nr:AI-2E family transporter [Rhodocyclaceae bacterium]